MERFLNEKIYSHGERGKVIKFDPNCSCINCPLCKFCTQRVTDCIVGRKYYFIYDNIF